MAARDAGPPRVYVASGHMIDAPGRPQPRFPGSKEQAVRSRISRQLDRWEVGSQDVAVCGGARGTDILFAEECLKRGARVLLLIALPEAQFIDQSVRLPGTDWEARYRALRDKCETRFQHEALGAPAAGDDAFARNNFWCLQTARHLAPSSGIRALLVWDGQPAGDGPGGTADFVAKLRQAGGEVAVVDPTKLP